MSWEAVQWANKQRLRLPQEQFVLLMLANCADPEGVAFSWWKRREHWWTYLVEHTRLSRTTIFRHLSTIEELGLGIRQKTFQADGTPSFIMTLDLTKIVIIDPEEMDMNQSQSHCETQSHDDTQSRGGTESVPIAGLHIEELPSESKNPPNPPSGGVQVVRDQELEDDIAELSRTYPAPITNLPRLRIVLAAMSHLERKRVLLAVKGYAAHIADCDRRKKPCAVKHADRWVSTGMWLGYVEFGEKAQVAALRSTVPIDSPSAKALSVLCRIARAPPPFESNGKVLLMRPLSVQALALAAAPTQWVFIDAAEKNQVKAWDDLIARELAGKARPPLVHDRNPGGKRGFMAPWPWPPRKDGTLSPTGPPGLSDQDAKDFVESR